MKGNEEAIVSPEFFFQLECDLNEWKGKGTKLKKHLLPQFCTLVGEEPFADIAMAWSHDGLRVFVDTHEGIIQEGASFELFIDTKNLKTARTTHRFCHHFLFYFERIEGTIAKEVTRVRTEDTHPLCNPEELEVHVEKKKNGSVMELFIPEKCLVGYQPEKGRAIGLSYCLQAGNGRSQHFGVATIQMDFYPYLWSSGILV